MSYLIRDTRTREYFHEGSWTLDPYRAEVFPDATKVVAACVRFQLRDVELVLQFGLEARGPYSIDLPLPENLRVA